MAVVDGWFRTGDLGTLDADGILTIVDRKKDMIVRNGYSAYPSEAESAMVRHPAGPSGKILKRELVAGHFPRSHAAQGAPERL